MLQEGCPRIGAVKVRLAPADLQRVVGAKARRDLDQRGQPVALADFKNDLAREDETGVEAMIGDRDRHDRRASRRRPEPRVGRPCCDDGETGKQREG